MANIPADANPLRDTSFLPSTDNSEKAHFSALYDIPCLPKGSVKQGDAIGQGAFGCIYRGTYNNTTVAIKHINMGHVDTKGVDKMVQNELKLLYRLRESNFVIPLIGYYRHTEFRVWIVMEYAENGDLAKYLRKGYLKGKWLAKAHICTSLAKAVDGVHHYNVTHGDLKAQNILIDRFLTPKLADFGVSKTFTSISRGAKLGATLRWMAPERLNETTKPTREQLVRADIYGYGMVVWQVITDGGLPYEHVTRENVLFARKLNAMHNKPNSDWSPVDDVGKIPDDVPIIFRYLVDQCLASEPSHRPSLALVQKILNKYLAISAESRESPLDYSPSTEPLHYSPSTEPLDYSPSTEPLRHNPFTEILDDSSVTEILDCSSSTETLDYTEARDCSSSAEPLGYSPSESDFDSLIEFEEPNHNTFTKFEEPNRNEMKAEPLGGGTVKGEFTPTPATPSGSSTSRTGTRLTRGRNSSAAQRSERPSLSTLGSKSSTSKSRVSSPRLRQRTRAKLKEMLEQLYRGE